MEEKYAGMSIAEVVPIKQLEDENTKLKKLVAYLSLGSMELKLQSNLYLIPC